LPTKDDTPISKGGVGSGRYPKGSGKQLLRERLGNTHKILGMKVDNIHESEDENKKQTIVRMTPYGDEGESTRHYLIEEHKDDPDKDLIYASTHPTKSTMVTQSIESVNPDHIKEDGVAFPARIGAKEYTQKYGKGFPGFTTAKSEIGGAIVKGGVGSGRYPAGSGAHPKKEPSKAKAFFDQDKGYMNRPQPTGATAEYKAGEKEKMRNIADFEYGRWKDKAKDKNNPEYHEALGRTGALLALNNVVEASPNKLKAIDTLSTMIEQTRIHIKTHPDKSQQDIYIPYNSVLTRYKGMLENSIYDKK